MSNDSDFPVGRPGTEDERGTFQACPEYFFAGLPACVYSLVQRPGGHYAVTFVSAGVYDLLGLKADGLMQDIASFVAVCHSEDLGILIHRTRRSARTATGCHVECRILHPQGGERWIELRSGPPRASNEAMCWNGFMHDVTERKRAEVQLRKAEEAFRSMAENSPDPIFRYDRDCRRLYANPAICEAVGKSMTDLTGRVPADNAILTTAESKKLMAAIREVFDRDEMRHIDSDFVAPEGGHRDYHVVLVPERVGAMKCNAAAGKQAICESHHRAGDGRIFPVEISVSEFEYAGEKFDICMVRDITERKQAQEALYKQEQEFRTLVEHSPDTIARYDRDCRRMYVNPQLARDLGGDMTRILGTTPVQFPGFESAQGYENALRRAFALGEEQHFEYRWQHGDAKFCHHIRVMPEFDLAGQVVHVLAVGRACLHPAP